MGIDQRIGADLFVVDRCLHPMHRSPLRSSATSDGSRSRGLHDEPGFFIGIRLGQLLDMGSALDQDSSVVFASPTHGSTVDNNSEHHLSSIRSVSKEPNLVRHAQGPRSDTSAGTWQVELQNTFLTVMKRPHRSVHRSSSEYKVLCEGPGPVLAEEGVPEGDEQGDEASISSKASGSAVSASIGRSSLRIAHVPATARSERSSDGLSSAGRR
jgi:hypothetical protein